MSVAHRLGAGRKQASHARLHTIGPAAGQTRLAIATTESRPIIHHGQTQSHTRQNVHELQLCGGVMLLSSYLAPTGPLALPRGVTRRPQVRPPWQLRQLKSGPAYTMASPRAFRGKIQSGCSCAGGMDALQ